MWGGSIDCLAPHRSSSRPLFGKCEILNIFDLVKLLNLLFIHRTINLKVPVHISSYFEFNKIFHKVCTRGQSIGLLNQVKPNTTKFGIFSISYQAIYCWNFFQHHFSELDLSSISYGKLKHLITSYFLQDYFR